MKENVTIFGQIIFSLQSIV